MTNEEIKKIISKMTLHEKVYLCTGMNSWRTRSYKHHGIPSILVSDGTSGVRFQKGSDTPAEVSFYDSLGGSFDNEEALERTCSATCFPSGSAIACTFNQKLLRTIGEKLAGECKELGINVLLGPGMNIHRHPLTARNFEYYSEDPVLTGEMAASLVSGVQSQGVGTCMKLFAAHNSDTRRTRVNVLASERALREIYLAGYERVVQKASPVSMMTAYNKINGEEMSGNNRITRDIVKGEWGFDGALVCDWGAVKDPVEASYGRIDLQMPLARASAQYLESQVSAGHLDEALVDERCARILKLVYQMKDWEASWGEVLPENHHELAREAAAESMVLLKNEDGILPLKGSGQRLAVIGRMAKDPIYQGTGCAVVHPKCVDIPYEEICKVYGAEASEMVSYAEAYHKFGDTTDDLVEEAVRTAANADLALIFVGNFLPGEDDDYNRKDIKLHPGMVRVIEAVAAVNPNCIVILAGGEVCEMPWRHQVKGLLLSWFSGEGMGKALSDLLFGKVSPSGRLANTIPERLEDTPAYLSFDGNTYEMPYAEDIFVGYRYYDKKKVEPAYPFGYGLSYTTFAYSNASVEEVENSSAVSMGNGADPDLNHVVCRVSINVTNTGHMAASEVVQLYIRPTFRTKLPRPVRELKNFGKVSLVPGETKTVTLEVSERDFAYYDPKACTWVVDDGAYAIELAHSSREICKTLMVTREEKAPKLSFGYDCGFYELFQDETARRMFYEFLVEQGLVTADQVDEKLEKGIVWSFWAIRSFLDMNANGLISFEAFNAYLDKVNMATNRR